MTALAVVVLPAIGAAAALGLRRQPRASAVVAIGALGVTVIAAVAVSVTQPATSWRWGGALELHLAVEGFARVMVVLVPAVAIPVLAYGAATVHEGRARLLVLLVAFVAAMELLVVAADLLTLLIAWELVGAFSWALIGHGWGDAANPQSAAEAFVTTRVGDLGLYLAAGMALAATGGFAFADLAGMSGVQQHLLAAGVLLAVAAKSAQLPFSPWLFSAMAGPTPVSALLHSATLVSAGAYLAIRLAPSLEPVGWFLPAVAVLGLATALAGGIVAAVHRDAKRVLAASTSAQYGLMLVAVGAGSTAAAGAQLITHAGFKSLLFLGAGVAIHAAGTGQLAGMRLGDAFPKVAVLSAVGALALAAVPPLGGAWSKQQIAAAAAHSSGWLLAGVFVAGALSAVYATRYQLLAYGSPRQHPSRARPGRGDPRWHPTRAEMVALGALAGVTIALSLLWLPGGQTIVRRTTDGVLYQAPLWEFGLALAITAGAVAAVVALWRADRLVSLGIPAPAQSMIADWFGLPALCRGAVVDPTLALAGVLARADDRVIDAGVRGVARLAGALSRIAWHRAEWTLDGAVHAIAATVTRTASRSRAADEHAVDGAVRAVAAAAMGGAVASRVTDERLVDGAVEGTAWLFGASGRISRKAQTGQSHHYYLLVAAGFAVAAAILVVSR